MKTLHEVSEYLNGINFGDPMVAEVIKDIHNRLSLLASDCRANHYGTLGLELANKLRDIIGETSHAK